MNWLRKKGIISNSFGLSLIEVLLAVALTTLVVGVLIHVGVTSLRTADAGRMRSVAISLAREGVEALRSFRDQKGFDYVNEGNYKLDCGPNFCEFSELSPITGGFDEDPDSYNLSPPYESFYREIIITVTDPEGETKSVEANVYWEQHGRYVKVSSITYLTRWREAGIPTPIPS